MFVNSKDVAEMLGKRHDNLLRAIRKYSVTLGEDAESYFILDGTGARNTSYKVTEAGCELLGGRLIGKAGDEFKEWYRAIFGNQTETITDPTPAIHEEVSKEYTVPEVAEILGVSERSVYNWVKQGKINSIQREVMIPTQKTFITEEDLEAYQKEREGK